MVGVDLIGILNIFQATRFAMERALLNLAVSPDFLLIDGHVPIQTDHPRLQIIHGDQKSLSISCASIVAKVLRDRLMTHYHGLYPDYGFIRHKGYGTPEHLRVLEKLGPSPIHRLGFRPVSERIPHADLP